MGASEAYIPAVLGTEEIMRNFDGHSEWKTQDRSVGRFRPIPLRFRRLLSWGLLVGSLLASGSTIARAGGVDADRVIRDATVQCEFGPRIPGTLAHRKARDWIRAELEALGMDVFVQEFQAVLALTGRRTTAWNLWAVPSGTQQGDLILLSAHWDTRPFADEEPRGSREYAFPGANDGAASVAFVLEILRQAQGTPLEDHLAAAFFDAEDSGVQGQSDSWCIGSQYGAAHPPAWMERVTLGINIDMIASPGVELRREGWSEASAPEAMDRLWRIGRDLAPRTFLNQPRPKVMDDHVPFVQKGYRYINLIGLPNPHWHRRSDTPENLDARSISQVGQVLLEFLAQELR